MDADIIVSDLDIMANAPNYRRWLFSHVRPFLGRRVLEVGAGIGNYAEFMIDREQLVCIDIHPGCVTRLKERFAAYPNVDVHQMDVTDSDILQLDEATFDTVICLNVLEHVWDGHLAMQHMTCLLAPRGRVVLVLPAHRFLFGMVDEALGHWRRYGRRDARTLLESNGLSIERLYFTNLLGIAGWFLNNRISQRREECPQQITLYDRFVVSWLSRLEAIVPPPTGLSLFCVGQKASSTSADRSP